MNQVKFLQIEPTTRCNFSCGFCCGRHMDQNNLPFEIFKQTLNEFPQLEHIELQGEGEPLLHSQFFEMVKLAQSRGIKISIITNGSMFSRERIEKILESGIEFIRISIESTNPQEFLKIRGGNLENIINGIKSFIQVRNEQNSKKPAIGFAVTVLKQTQDMLPAIVNLYEELEMDGGISVQLLNLMNAYSEIYDTNMFNQILSKEEEKILWSKYEEIVNSMKSKKSDIKHFYDELFSLNVSKQTNKERIFESCPWLDNALYVNRNGIVTACCRIKDTDKFALGKIGVTTIKTILEARDDMKQKMCGGKVPEACCNCEIAESISTQSSE
jgi:MoaA/NifB/PqqE/SkfB family radical SAM enzyme